MTEGTLRLRSDGVLEEYFAGERRRFRLPVFGELRTLQDKHDIGPAGFEMVFRTNTWRAEHVIDTIRLGLIGAGMPDGDADKLVTSTITEGRLLKHAPLAHMIIIATLGPLTEEPAEKKPEAAESESTAANSESDHADNSPIST